MVITVCLSVCLSDCLFLCLSVLCVDNSDPTGGSGAQIAGDRQIHESLNN